MSTISEQTLFQQIFDYEQRRFNVAVETIKGVKHSHIVDPNIIHELLNQTHNELIDILKTVSLQSSETSSTCVEQFLN